MNAKKTLINMTVGLGIMVMAAHHVSAQTSRNCAPRPVVLEQLTEKFGETRQSIGLGSQGAVVEVFASAETGSWTITVTSPSGLTCLIASGQSFETMAEAGIPQGNEA